ncbi:hypothetical protein BDZ91DRAFT_759503 [Kalaharituber pfeilii]|nr:hypothetical protein BDZ91DRAFT_759503 [Kalaharituber pfeilii]
MCGPGNQTKLAGTFRYPGSKMRFTCKKAAFQNTEQCSSACCLHSRAPDEAVVVRKQLGTPSSRTVSLPLSLRLSKPSPHGTSEIPVEARVVAILPDMGICLILTPAGIIPAGNSPACMHPAVHTAPPCPAPSQRNWRRLLEVPCCWDFQQSPFALAYAV